MALSKKSTHFAVFREKHNFWIPGKGVECAGQKWKKTLQLFKLDRFLAEECIKTLQSTVENLGEYI